MRLPRGAEEKAELQLAPMIDVIFQLIIFFMCATTFNPAETEMKVNLPTEAVETTQVAIPDEVVIQILNDGGIVVNNQEYDSPSSKDLPSLRDMLTRLVGAFGKEQAVIIQPGDGVKHGRVVDVLNACAASEVSNISFYSSASE